MRASTLTATPCPWEPRLRQVSSEELLLIRGVDAEAVGHDWLRCILPKVLRPHGKLNEAGAVTSRLSQTCLA